ncbi:MAG: thiamine pyrophosphate-dependent enzyme [Bacteroidales bacterium]|jgi:2-oxoglutarate/2-oxoacid ferredoxin oxidoreductase subunit beta
MSNTFIKDQGLPFCRGCGHSTIAINTEKALTKLGLQPLDVILVTDIGCHGIIDKSFNTHTVHGLHGRSVALGAGISAGIFNPDKKVIVFIGDGGATIGMQHIIDAAHNGYNMTVVIHNNMLYGMTGGQPSEYTPMGFKTPTKPGGSTKYSYDICKIVAAAGGTYVRRVMGIGDFSDALAEAFGRPGFSLVEVMEICPSYGVKSNPEMKLSKVVENAGLATEVIANLPASPYLTNRREALSSLFSSSDVIPAQAGTRLQAGTSTHGELRIMMCGSAGEGTQVAAELLARAGIRAGLQATKKGSYPVTVGVGFSAAEVILSPDEINYTGTVTPDYMIITSKDGLDFGRKAAGRMKSGKIFLDESLESPATGAEIVRFPFREKTGARNASFMGVFYFLHDTNLLPVEVMVNSFNENKISKKVSADQFLQWLTA